MPSTNYFLYLSKHEWVKFAESAEARPEARASTVPDAPRHKAVRTAQTAGSKPYCPISLESHGQFNRLLLPFEERPTSDIFGGGHGYLKEHPFHARCFSLRIPYFYASLANNSKHPKSYCLDSALDEASKGGPRNAQIDYRCHGNGISPSI